MKRFFFLVFLGFSFALSAAEIPRRIIAFWDSEHERLVDALVPNTSEVILNHLGFDVLYFDLIQPLPDISHRNDIAAILLCQQPETQAKDPDAFIDWLLFAVNRGIKLIVMRNPGFQNAVTKKQNELYEKIGLTDLGQTVPFAFNYSIQYQDPKLFTFEKSFPTVLPSFAITQLSNKSKAKSFLRASSASEPDSFADLVVIGPAGAYVSAGYESSFEYTASVENPRSIGWYLNPFLFFKLALGMTTYPVPDTTTLAGRRIFYSVCHGDAFNIATSVEEYQKDDEIYASQVILDKVILPNPDIPVAVAIVAADVDEKWAAKRESRAVAQRYFSTPHVEAASHTYSHPFDWNFFAPGTNQQERELNYLYLYRYPTWKDSYLSWFHAMYSKYKHPEKPHKYSNLVVTPRAYAKEPFNIDQEIKGSIEFLNELAPPNKKVSILLWSGDGMAWGEAVERTYQAGVKNLGVGSTRFDKEYPSYIFVGPLGRRPGGWIQIYNSSNGENDYTYEWKKDFYRFSLLPETLKNTGSPIRVKPLCLYYHSYSGQLAESVQALLKNIDYIRTENFIALLPSRFVDVGLGFYHTKIEQLDNWQWRISNRTGLQTVRFDDAQNQQIDIARSLGVIGFTTFQNSLYVYLDKGVREAVVALAKERVEPPTYLIDSNWEIWNLQRQNGTLTFHAQGWGKMQMNWFVPRQGTYTITARPANQPEVIVKKEVNDSLLNAEFDLPFNTLVNIKIESL